MLSAPLSLSLNLHPPLHTTEYKSSSTAVCTSDPQLAPTPDRRFDSYLISWVLSLFWILHHRHSHLGCLESLSISRFSGPSSSSSLREPIATGGLSQQASFRELLPIDAISLLEPSPRLGLVGSGWIVMRSISQFSQGITAMHFEEVSFRWH